jgi:N-acetyltransferase
MTVATLNYAAPVTLTGQTVRLEPLREDHVPDLFESSRDEEIWRHLPTDWPRTLQELQASLENTFMLHASGDRLRFAVIDLASNKAIGTTGYLRIDTENRSLEIGGTWYATPYQRTSVNTQCKYLLLKRAFEDLDCVRVQITTDELNTRSRAAIERIGGVFEGIARHDRVVKGGRLRSTARYALLADEWPARKAWFKEKLSIAD